MTFCRVYEMGLVYACARRFVLLNVMNLDHNTTSIICDIWSVTGFESS